MSRTLSTWESRVAFASVWLSSSFCVCFCFSKDVSSVFARPSATDRGADPWEDWKPHKSRYQGCLFEIRVNSSNSLRSRFAYMSFLYSIIVFFLGAMFLMIMLVYCRLLLVFFSGSLLAKLVTAI